jgi:HD-like signal output (HDOD) protein
LSASLTSINQMGDTTSIQQLSDRVIRDFALTQKLLRLVNSASIGTGKVTKVSEAITILGIGQLRALATSLLLASGAGGKGSPGIAMALTDSFVAGLISRNIGRIARLDMVEELFICGMFSSLGELLSLYYLPEEYSEIERRVLNGGLHADSASRAVLGISFEELAIAVARHWRFPPEIVNALSPLPPGILPAARDPAERMWQCAVYARELGALARINDTEARKTALEAHIARFAASIRLDVAMVRELMTRSIAAAGNYIATAGFSVSRTPMLHGMTDLCDASTVVAHTAPIDVADSTANQPAVYENTVVLPKDQPPGWRARITRALRSVF